MLMSLNGNALMQGREVTIDFGEASVEGSGGCNTYGGSYTASEDSLSLSGLYWTERACMQPEGIMEQEQAYFQALNTVASYRVDAERLEVYDRAGVQVLEFVSAGLAPTLDPPAPTPTRVPLTPVPTATPTLVSPTAMSTRVLPTATPTATVAPTWEPPMATSGVLGPPPGTERHMDAASGVSVWVPKSWTIVEPGPDDGRTMLLSYPQGKYAGGEPLQLGDTKCDLTIHAPGINVADVVPKSSSDPPVTILSEQEIVLRSGRSGRRFELESMGRSLSLITGVGERMVVLTCFGELEPFDEIAVTLGLGETPVSTTSGLSLNCTLEMDETYPVGEPVTLRFELHNQTDRPLYVLNWYTPLEGTAGEIFRVTRNGEVLIYQGMLVKRGDPVREEYVAIAPGEVVSAEVDLSMGYDLSTPGSYQVQFTAGLQDATDDASLFPRKRDDHRPHSLSCNTVGFIIRQ
jgi:heat shock protein HslJ